MDHDITAFFATFPFFFITFFPSWFCFSPPRDIMSCNAVSLTHRPGHGRTKEETGQKMGVAIFLLILVDFCRKWEQLFFVPILVDFCRKWEQSFFGCDLIDWLCFCKSAWSTLTRKRRGGTSQNPWPICIKW